MRNISIAGVAYRLNAVERDGQWVARAEREENGRLFGAEYSGATEIAALDGLSQWLEWQHEHQKALEALQAAERAYHRAVAGSAFVNSAEASSASGLQKESLDVLEMARIKLDEVRNRKPQ
jgi:hypothetical protein